jgi:hypothetical protein
MVLLAQAAENMAAVPAAISRRETREGWDMAGGIVWPRHAVNPHAAVLVRVQN